MPATHLVQRSKIFAPDRQTTRPHSRSNGKHPSPGRQRFDAHHRLPDQAAYSRVFDGASRSRDRLFTILSCKNQLDTARLGLAISKKHCRLASGRNRLKRIVRESFRQHAAMLAGLDLVVLARSAAAEVDNRRLFDSLAKHWQKTRSAQFDARSDSQ